MKNRTTLNQFLSIVLVGILLFGCNTAENDWNKAKLANTRSDYQIFIKKHSGSKFSDKAKMALDSFDWITVLKTHNVDSLKSFLKNNSSSNFLKNSNFAMDSIEWNIANYSRDTTILSSYIGKYPNSSNRQKAEDIIWEIKWPPVKIEKANSVVIYVKGEGTGHGTQMFFMGGNGVAAYSGGKPPEVRIIREFENEADEAKTILGLKIGMAYLHVGLNKYKFIRKVDLGKTDQQLCAEFGVYY